MKSRVWSRIAALVCAVAAATAIPESRATESLADVELQARIKELSPAPAAGGSVARVEVVLQSLREARVLDLKLEGPGGESWRFHGRPVVLEPTRWNGPGGEPLEPDVDGVPIAARGWITTTVAVPVDKDGLREIVLRATGTADGRPIVATAVVRVVLPGDPGAIVEADGLAHFSLGEVK